MIKTLYDPEVEKRGIKQGSEQGKIEDAKNFLKLGVSEEIVSQGTGLSIDMVRELKQQLRKDVKTGILLQNSEE